MSYVRILNETPHHLRCVSVCVRMWKPFEFGNLQWTTTMLMMTYVNALKSKCVFGGRPGRRTIMKNTTRKFRTARYKHLHSPILSRSLALYVFKLFYFTFFSSTDILWISRFFFRLKLHKPKKKCFKTMEWKLIAVRASRTCSVVLCNEIAYYSMHNW